MDFERGAGVLKYDVHGPFIVQAIVEGHEPRKGRAVQCAQLAQQLIALRLVKDVDHLHGKFRLRWSVDGPSDDRARALPKHLEQLQILQSQPHNTSHLRPVDGSNSLPIDDEILLHECARLR